jgi:hypothetical protein
MTNSDSIIDERINKIKLYLDDEDKKYIEAYINKEAANRTNKIVNSIKLRNLLMIFFTNYAAPLFIISCVSAICFLAGGLVYSESDYTELRNEYVTVTNNLRTECAIKLDDRKLELDKCNTKNDILIDVCGYK